MNNERFTFASAHLRPMFIKIWFAAFVLALGATFYLHTEIKSHTAYDWLERQVALLDQFASNDFIVEIIPLATGNRLTNSVTIFHSDASAVEHSSVLGSTTGETNESENNEPTHQTFPSGTVAGSYISVVNTPQHPGSGMTAGEIDRLVMQNIQSIIDAGWLNQVTVHRSGGGGSTTINNITNGVSAIGDAITSATQGSILFGGADGVLAQNNANFFWDDTNNRLGIGTNTPASKLHIAVAPDTTANYGLLSLGNGSFDGSTAGFFNGSSSGTAIAVLCTGQKQC
jgi:hypothetical protein